jgi:hypothetical protein
LLKELQILFNVTGFYRLVRLWGQEDKPELTEYAACRTKRVDTCGKFKNWYPKIGF